MICSSCKQDKDANDFYNKTESRLQSMCKRCLLDYQMSRWHRRKLEAIAYKGGKCNRCGFDSHWAALQFHHLYDKEFSWNKMRLISQEKLFKELDKCELLCANCHAIEHAGPLRCDALSS